MRQSNPKPVINTQEPCLLMANLNEEADAWPRDVCLCPKCRAYGGVVLGADGSWHVYSDVQSEMNL